jgi:hypothetical protein
MKISYFKWIIRKIPHMFHRRHPSFHWKYCMGCGKFYRSRQR